MIKIKKLFNNYNNVQTQLSTTTVSYYHSISYHQHTSTYSSQIVFSRSVACYATQKRNFPQTASPCPPVDFLPDRTLCPNITEPHPEHSRAILRMFLSRPMTITDTPGNYY